MAYLVIDLGPHALDEVRALPGRNADLFLEESGLLVDGVFDLLELALLDVELVSHVLLLALLSEDDLLLLVRDQVSREF